MRRVTTLLFVLSAIAIAPYNVAAQSTILFDNPSSGGDAGAINLFLPEGDPNEVFSTGHVTQVIFDTAVRIDSVTSYLTNDTGAFDATEVAVDIFDGDKLEFFGDLPFTGGDFGAAGVTDLSINSSGNLTTLTANNLSITLDAGTYWFGITPLQVTGVSQTESLLNADTSSGVGATFYRQPNVWPLFEMDERLRSSRTT